MCLYYSNRIWYVFIIIYIIYIIIWHVSIRLWMARAFDSPVVRSARTGPSADCRGQVQRGCLWCRVLLAWPSLQASHQRPVSLHMEMVQILFHLWVLLNSEIFVLNVWDIGVRFVVPMCPLQEVDKAFINKSYTSLRIIQIFYEGIWHCIARLQTVKPSPLRFQKCRGKHMCFNSC